MDLDRIQDLFFEAKALPDAERLDWLEAQCAHDTVTLQQVMNLLRIEPRAQEVLGESGSGVMQPILGELEEEMEGKDWIGKQIGRYKIIRMLGHGGMGTVFLAEEQGAVVRRVAVKLVRRGMDNEHMIRRFKTERTILGALQHPNIARLLDADVTEDGQPYFVMAYIKGLPIDVYCDENRLRVDERLTLFLPVLEAVGFAHENQIIHRDLKPGNILITDTAEVKLLDFGIAKVLDPKRYNLSFAVTQTGFQLLTPEYASPEQISGKAITPASDVYQLGVLLYELLTGHRPFRMEQYESKFDIARAILEDPPTRPSAAIERQIRVSRGRNASVLLSPEEITAARRTSVDRLKARLSGDLEYLLHKALAKKVEDRYTSAAAFATDIRRHLQGEPLLQPSGAGHLLGRIGKFFRRG